MDEGADVEFDVVVAELPKRYANKLAPLSEPFEDGADVPVFWHVGGSGGTTLQTILSRCLGLVEASQVGVAFDDHDKDEVGVAVYLVAWVTHV